MKNYILLFGLLMLTWSCQDTRPPSADSTFASGEMPAPQTETVKRGEIQRQINLHGIGILHAYYCLGVLADREVIEKELGITHTGDVQYFLWSEADKRQVNVLGDAVERAWTGLSEVERRKIRRKALRWLDVSRVFSGQFCEFDGEMYFEAAYEIPAIQRIIDQYIDPKLGQSIQSLASGEMNEIQIKIWTYLAEADREERLSIISEFLGKCAEMHG